MSPGDLDRMGGVGLGLMLLLLRRLCVTLVGPRFTLWQLGQGHDWGGEGEALIFFAQGGGVVVLMVVVYQYVCRREMQGTVMEVGWGSQRRQQ